MGVRIGLTGDVMLGRQVDRHQASRPPHAIWGNLLERIQSLDGLLINLECCLSNRGERWTRTHRPFHFRANPEWAVSALERASVDCCALANNHVLDYGEVALQDTLDSLDDAGIAHAGAGLNREEALEPATFGAGDLDVTVVSLTDNTPEYAAGEDSPGTARVEIDVENSETRETVHEALDTANATDPDLLIASLHWGPNMVTDPPERFRSFGQWLVEAGVDVIHGHSAHVFQGIQVHQGRPICYDTGDFVDDYAVDRDLRNDRSFLYELTVTPGGRPAELRLIPTEIYDYSVHLASQEAAEWNYEQLRQRSAAFETDIERDEGALVIDLG